LAKQFVAVVYLSVAAKTKRIFQVDGRAPGVLSKPLHQLQITLQLHSLHYMSQSAMLLLNHSPLRWTVNCCQWSVLSSVVVLLRRRWKNWAVFSPSTECRRKTARNYW